MKQFFYERREPRQPKEGDTAPVFVTFIDSFAVDAVRRTIEYEEGKIVVLLNDGHEETREYPVKDKMGKVNYEKKREWVHSEIILNEKDTVRFRTLMGYQYPVTNENAAEVGTPMAD